MVVGRGPGCKRGTAQPRPVWARYIQFFLPSRWNRLSSSRSSGKPRLPSLTSQGTKDKKVGSVGAKPEPRPKGCRASQQRLSICRQASLSFCGKTIPPRRQTRHCRQWIRCILKGCAENNDGDSMVARRVPETWTKARSSWHSRRDGGQGPLRRTGTEIVTN